MSPEVKARIPATDRSPKWMWGVLVAWLGFSMAMIGIWQIEDVIAGTVCTNPASAQWEIFK